MKMITLPNSSLQMSLSPVKKIYEFASTPFDYSPSLINVATDQANCMKDYIADCIMPYVPTDACTFMYQDWNKTQSYNPVNDDVGPMSRVHEVDLQQSTLVTANLEGHGLDAAFTWCMQQATSSACSNTPPNYRERVAAYLTSLVKLNREIRVVNLVNDPAFYAASNKLDLTGIEFDNATTPSDPLTVISNAIANSPQGFNWLAASKSVMSYLRRHPSFLGNVDARGAVSNASIAATLGLDGICEGRSYANLTGTNVPLWGPTAAADDYILLFSKNESVFSTDCPIPTFAFTARSGGWFAANLQSQFHGLRGTEYVRVGEEVKEVVTSYNFGYLIYNIFI